MKNIRTLVVVSALLIAGLAITAYVRTRAEVPHSTVKFTKNDFPVGAYKQIVDLDLKAEELFSSDEWFVPVATKFDDVFAHLYNEPAIEIIREKFKFEPVEGAEDELLKLSLDLQPPTFAQVVLDEIMADTSRIINDKVADHVGIRKRIAAVRQEYLAKQKAVDEVENQLIRLKKELGVVSLADDPDVEGGFIYNGNKKSAALDSLRNQLKDLEAQLSALKWQLVEPDMNQYVNPYRFQILEKADGPLLTDEQVKEYRLLRKKFRQLPKMTFDRKR